MIYTLTNTWAYFQQSDLNQHQLQDRAARTADGFFPQRQKSLYEVWPLMHGKDERIDVRDVGFAVDCYRDVSKELLG